MDARGVQNSLLDPDAMGVDVYAWHGRITHELTAVLRLIAEGGNKSLMKVVAVAHEQHFGLGSKRLGINWLFLAIL